MRQCVFGVLVKHTLMLLLSSWTSFFPCFFVLSHHHSLGAMIDCTLIATQCLLALAALLLAVVAAAVDPERIQTP